MLRPLVLTLILLLPLPAARAATDASDRRARYFVQRYYHGDFRPTNGGYLPPVRTGSGRRRLTPDEMDFFRRSLAGHTDRFTAGTWVHLWSR